MNFYNWLLKKLTPFIIWVGGFYSPYSRKKINGEFYYKVRDMIESGTILLSTTHGELSNLINPSSIKHGAIYIGPDPHGICYVTEAVGSGVKRTDLVTFLTTKDIIVALKPNFLTSEDKALLPIEANRFVGIPYDYIFEKGDKAHYCFEHIIRVLNALRPELFFNELEIVKGKSAFAPETFLDDTEKFTVLFDSRIMKP